MKIKSIRVSRSEMKKRVARFADLRGFDGGLPDSRHPDAIRTLYNVIGFQPHHRWVTTLQKLQPLRFLKDSI